MALLRSIKPNADICRKAYMTVVVMTHPDGVERRRILRLMLRNPKLHRSRKINYVFVTGSSVARLENHRLKKESEDHGDILQFSLIDIHRNAALLSTLTFNHLIERCASLNENGIDFVFKVEEDSYFNLELLGRKLDYLSPDEKIVGGRCQISKPERNINDMAFIGDDVYPHEYFPVSCSKHAYVLSYKALVDIIKIAPNIPSVLHLEEVFITGLCRAAAGINFVNLTGFYWPSEPSVCQIDTAVVAIEHISEVAQRELVQRLMLGRFPSIGCLITIRVTFLSVVVIIALIFVVRTACKKCCRNL
ncbi:beta-1,3-galactosyltransferase 2-like isoform X2 [Lineus longissimus]|uniref:beta-1,3-galactosyltransferase 2-like isoform X2 n=1 Tax=Lineus longissimus TaxID=88925 RepID=UPI00315D500F